MFYLNDWLKSYKILNIKIKLKTKTYRWLKLLFTNEIKLKVSFVVVEESFVETFWFEIGVKFRAKGFLVGITNIWQRILITPTMLVLAHNHSIHEQRQPWRQRQQPTTTSPRDQTRHTLPYPPLSLHISLTVRLPLSSGPDLALRTCRWCHQTICIAIRRQYCDGPMIHFFSPVQYSSQSFLIDCNGFTQMSFCATLSTNRFVFHWFEFFCCFLSERVSQSLDTN